MQYIYFMFAQFVSARSHNPLVEAVQPLLRNQLAVMKASLGSPDSFNPTTTHVILVAILIVLLAQRNRGA